ncbi:alpha-2-macroglobulin family protein [Pseudogemmobacter sp. W21_MBD1_M6]|uniref:alpha-2-macroglobulin family protein n=1 Tax=Pseudogemmobacter sp. W21_MBD1_M6 TaxID=3240271 RepID=UPI003F94741A
MRIFRLALFLALGLPQMALAEGAVPARRAAISQDVDFYGSDLKNIFDTTLEACQKACLADDRCHAFTFNSRSNSCFPKSDITDRKPYQGAVSAQIFETDSGVLANSETKARELSFLRDDDLTRAKAQATGLALDHPTGEFSADDLLQAKSDARASGDTSRALRLTGAVLALTDAPDLWIDYARLALDMAGRDKARQQEYRDRAVTAAINGYLRSASPATSATALTVLAGGLQQLGRGRDMIPALRLAQQVSPRDDTALMLEDAVAKYGFRIIDQTVDNDAARPRICATFSEQLAQSGVDYGPFVSVEASGLTVEAQGQQICVEGVEHGSRYRVTFREGLPAESGETLTKPATLTLYVRDRTPSVRFPGRAYVLPKSGDAALPIETVNLTGVDLVLRRISDRNLLRSIQSGYLDAPVPTYQQEDFAGSIAEEIWHGTGEVALELNRDVTTRLPLDGVVGGLDAGIYALQARVPGADIYDSPTATQWFVISDLGLTTMAGIDGLHVFVRSLGTAGAKAGITVTLLSRANAILAETETDSDGYARFDAGLTRGTGAAAPALVTAMDGDADIAFLSLTDAEFDLSDRGVEGREPAPPIDVFLTTDRGAYRAGDTIFATALTRDGDAAAIEGLPLTAILTRPDGVEYRRVMSVGAVAGGHVLPLPLGATVPRGTWKLSVLADPKGAALATVNVLVEDFLPERIDVALSLPDGPIYLSDNPVLTVQADYLFGAPGADLSIEGEVLLRAATGLAAYPGYLFGRHDEPFNARLESLPFGNRTDASGQGLVPVDLPDVEDPARPLELRVTARVTEGSGRPVERRISHALMPSGAMIGVKPLFDDVVAEGARARFDLLAVGAGAAPATMRVKWTMNRIETRYQWYQSYGNWQWEPVTTRSRIASEEVDLGAGPVTISAPVDWGQYELRVERVDGTFAATSTAFYAGWYAPADTSQTPDTLAVSLDKPAYKSGETAQLRVVPRYAGKALVTVVSNRLIDMKAVDVTEGENLIALPVTDDWGAGVYVTATVLRPMDNTAGRNPARALGVSYAAVDPGARKLTAGFEAPAEAAPRSALDVAVRVDGVTNGDTAYVTIAAVDLGILNLTGFDLPDATGHYFGQRKLGVGLRDIYGRLIDGMNGALGAVRSGGDAGAEMRMQSPPPTEELVAYFSGPVAVGADGLARASFQMPSFNGTVRLMAVAWSKTGVGQAHADVLVRDPVVVTASLPRFMAPTDVSALRLEIVHATGPSGRMGLDVTAQGLDLGAVPSGVDLADKGNAVLSVPVTAGAVGAQSVQIALTTPDGVRLLKTLTVPVLVNDPEIARTSRFDLADGAVFSLNSDVFSGLAAGSGAATLAIGPLARFDAPGLLTALDRYPYGCTEQITSRALPLLYFDEVATAMGLTNDNAIARRIAQAIARVLTNQASDGGFGLWRAESGDMWLDAYVTDFLSRAKAKGFAIPDTAFRLAVDNLRNQVNYAADFDEGGEALAYALMVLAREGAAAIGDLRYYADVKAEAFSTPLAVAQLGSALAFYGDQTRADALFALAARQLTGLTGPENTPVWRSDYGSNLRDAAGVLTLAVEAGSAVVDRTVLAQRIGAQGGQTRSTQEAMWSLLAANALIGDPSMQGITVNGVPVDGPMVRVVQNESGLDPTEIRNATGAPQTVTLTTFGVPTQPEPAGGNGYAIERSYFTLTGEPARIESVPVGTRLVAVLTVTPFGDGEARLMVNDPLPAGFEIDNPNLLRGGDIRALDWLDLTAETRSTEARSDRFLAAIDWRSDQAFRLGYIVRAISPGTYHQPAASVEDMYRPQFRARTAAGRVTVTQ